MKLLVAGGAGFIGSNYSAAIPNFIRRMLAGERPTIYGDGEQSRDFTYVANVVDANIRAATADGISGEVFNVACGSASTLNELMQALNEALHTRMKPRYAEARLGDIRDSLADVSKAKDRLGYTPKVDLTEGLRQTVAWYPRKS